MKSLLPDIRSAILLLVLVVVIVLVLSTAWMSLGFGTVQLLLDTQLINPQEYSEAVFLGVKFAIVTWILSLLCLFAAVWIAKWLMARHVTLRAIGLSTIGLVVLMLLFPSWNTEAFTNYPLMVLIWVIAPAAFYYFVAKRYLL